MKKSHKKLVFVLILLLLLFVFYLLFLQDGGDSWESRYDFIDHFFEAERVNFDRDNDIDRYLIDKTYSIGYLILDEVKDLFSGDVIQMAKKGKTVRSSIAKASDGGFRLKFAGSPGAKYEFVIQSGKGDSSFVVILDSGKEGRVTILDRDGRKVADVITYSLSPGSDNVFQIVFFDGYLLIYGNRQLLYQQKRNFIIGSAAFRIISEEKPDDYKVKFAYMSPKLKERINNKINAYCDVIPEHQFRKGSPSSNDLYPEHLLTINGKKSQFLRRTKQGGITRRAIYMWMNSSLTYKIRIPEKSVLSWHLTHIPKFITDYSKVHFSVEVHSLRDPSRAKKTVTNFQGLDSESHEFIPNEIDLSLFAGEECEIKFRSYYDGEHADKNRNVILILGSPVIYSEAKDDYLNVILILLDTLRGDHLGCYGYDRDTSKHIDEFARESVLFINAVSNSNWTLTSHMSLFTSRFPYETGYIKRDSWKRARIAENIKPLAEYLSDVEYRCFAFTEGSYVSSVFGFDRGFDLYREKRGSIDTAFIKPMEEIKRGEKNKFFLFFHTYEIHEPYTHDYYLKNRRPGKMSKREESIARYDSGIRFTDAEVGRFLAFLKREGLYDNSIIIITSDHGENFDRLKRDENSIEVGTHGRTFYESELRVPLIIRTPDKFRGGMVIDEQVSLVDILPTILSLTSIEYPGNLRGRNLSRLLNGRTGRERVEYAEATRGAEKFAVRTNRNKLIMNLKRRGRKTVESYEGYDLTSDSAEKRNLYRQRKALFNQLRDKLNAIKRSVSEARDRLILPKGGTQSGTERLKKDLGRLGYIN